MECPNKNENLNRCPCTYPSCPRKGKCCECLEYHLSREELPACAFSKQTEKTYDRSFAKFAKDHDL